jgi:hypothetical protein
MLSKAFMSYRGDPAASSSEAQPASDVGAEVLRPGSGVGIAAHTEGQKEVRRVLPLDSRADRELIGFIDHGQALGSVVAELEARDRQVEYIVVVSDVHEPVVREVGM